MYKDGNLEHISIEIDKMLKTLGGKLEKFVFVDDENGPCLNLDISLPPIMHEVPIVLDFNQEEE